MSKVRSPEKAPDRRDIRRELLSSEHGPPDTLCAGGPWRVALLYPNTYHVGMSSLGFQIAYRTINAIPGARAERFFIDTLADGSIESGTPMRDFNLIAISAAYEMDAPNIMDAIEKAGLPLEARHRTPEHGWPLVALGGVLASLNRFPLYPFIDVFCHGEAEIILPALIGRIMENGENRDAQSRTLNRAETLASLSEAPGIEITAGSYAAAGIAPPDDAAPLVDLLDRDPASTELWPRPAPPERAIMPSLEDGPCISQILTPRTEFSDMALVDLARGCANRCTFCWIGHNAPPYRVRPMDAILEQVRRLEPYTNRFGLVASAVGQHPQIDDICRELMARGHKVSYSSLRVEEVTPVMLRALAAGGQKAATLAPETASPRLRRLLGKPLTDPQIFDAAERILGAGVENLKLYFMIGIPTETDEEALEIAGFTEKIRGIMLRWGRPRGRMGTLGINLGIFVPKPGLPLNRLEPVPLARIKSRLKLLIRRLERIPNTHLNASSPELARSQGILSMGGPETAHYLLLLRRCGGDWRAANRRWRESRPSLKP